MTKAIIIDDEPLARDIIKAYLKPFADIEVVAECGDGFQGIKEIQQHEPDLIFLDIQMPKINGFEMLELIDEPPAVIFTTAFDEYAIKAFEANAIDYLLKPFSKERFQQAVQKFLQQSSASREESYKALMEEPEIPERQNRIVLKTGGKIKILPVEEICFLEAADDYVKLVTKDAHYLKNRTMSYFEKVLDQRTFVRVHRSYIINLNCLTRLDPYEKDQHVAVLINGAKISISKSGYQKLKAVLGI